MPIEFEVTTDLTPVSKTTIETNFEAVKAYLAESMAPYATVVVTPDSIADAKKTRADLRKIATGIDAQRKEIKKLWNRPYEEYEQKCKELTGIVNEAVTNIDGQIKEMENAAKEEKRQRLSDFFSEHSAEVEGYLTFEDVFDSKWLNATFSEIDAANSIESQIEDIKEGLETLRSMNSPYEAAMLSEYSKSHNLSKAIAEGRRLEAIQKAEAERKEREAEQTFSEPEVSAEDDVEPPAQPPQVTAQFIRPVAEDAPVKDKTYAYEFTFPALTKAQMYALKDCIDANGIKYKARKL